MARRSSSSAPACPKTSEPISDPIEDLVGPDPRSPAHRLGKRFQIGRLYRRLGGGAVSGFDRRRNGFHHDTSPVVVFKDLFDETFVPPDSLNLRGRFEDQLKQENKERMNLRQ